MADRIQIRRDTATNWTLANPTLAQGELGLESDTLKIKFGDGSTAWTSLAYGLLGQTGVAGSVWYNDSGVPGSELGVNGDYYLDISSGDVYTKLEDSWGSPIINLFGPQGDQGDAGNTWYSGSGVPSDGLGVNGDFYLNTATYDVYKKAAGTWGSILLNIKGAQGDTGVGITEQSIGFTVTGGITPKTLIVAEDANVSGTNTGDQDLDGYAPLADPTFTGDITLSENADIKLVSGLSADGKFTGIVETGIAGDALSFGQIVYFSSVDSRWELADAASELTAGQVRLGICILNATGDGEITKILVYGKVRADAQFPTFSIGAPVYISASAGELQVAQLSGTDQVIRIVGYGITVNELFFCPSNDYITHV